jgi:thymidylate synthase (FAD)
LKVDLLRDMGSDLTVVNAARVSMDKESDWEYLPVQTEPDRFGLTYELHEAVLSEKDEKLIRYLAEHQHWTPFGHCQATFRIKAPIFVARQLGKHQVGLVWNEVSRRYVKSTPEFFTPTEWRKAAENVKQGSSEETVDLSSHEGVDRKDLHEQVRYLLNDAEATYRALLEAGVCPEQARMILPQSMMTEWYWTGSLAAFARVVKLRTDPHSQKETRWIAEEISKEMARIFPVSWEALTA